MKIKITDIVKVDVYHGKGYKESEDFALDLKFLNGHHHCSFSMIGERVDGIWYLRSNSVAIDMIEAKTFSGLKRKVKKLLLKLNADEQNFLDKLKRGEV